MWVGLNNNSIDLPTTTPYPYRSIYRVIPRRDLGNDYKNAYCYVLKQSHKMPVDRSMTNFWEYYGFLLPTISLCMVGYVCLNQNCCPQCVCKRVRRLQCLLSNERFKLHFTEPTHNTCVRSCIATILNPKFRHNFPAVFVVL